MVQGRSRISQDGGSDEITTIYNCFQFFYQELLLAKNIVGNISCNHKLDIWIEPDKLIQLHTLPNFSCNF